MELGYNSDKGFQSQAILSFQAQKGPIQLRVGSFRASNSVLLLDLRCFKRNTKYVPSFAQLTQITFDFYQSVTTIRTTEPTKIKTHSNPSTLS